MFTSWLRAAKALFIPFILNAIGWLLWELCRLAKTLLTRDGNVMNPNLAELIDPRPHDGNRLAY
jgi:hypothetical protein